MDDLIKRSGKAMLRGLSWLSRVVGQACEDIIEGFWVGIEELTGWRLH